MTRMPRLPGLFAAEILVGETGEEYFHVLGDEEPTQVYYPAVPRCTRKALGGCVQVHDLLRSLAQASLNAFH